MVIMLGYTHAFSQVLSRLKGVSRQLSLNLTRLRRCQIVASAEFNANLWRSDPVNFKMFNLADLSRLVVLPDRSQGSAKVGGMPDLLPCRS